MRRIHRLERATAQLQFSREDVAMPTAKTPQSRQQPAPGERHPVTIEVSVRLEAIAIPEADGGYSIVVPALPGCVTEAETIEKARENVIDAAEGWLASTHESRKAGAIKVAKGET